MADFNTTDKEETLIERVRKKGLEYEGERDCPKYLILRIALARALQLNKYQLDSNEWTERKIGGEKGKEYDLEQITGYGKSDDNIDTILRGLLYIQHKEELDSKSINIFTDDKKYIEILGKYIHRGLYEMQYSWKEKDCFYQWCLDNLKLSDTINRNESSTILENTNSNSDLQGYFPIVSDYFKKSAVELELIEEKDSYRHHILKVRLKDSKKIQVFEQEKKFLKNEMGEPNISIQPLQGVSRAYTIAIPKEQDTWRYIGIEEYKNDGVNSLKTCNYELGIFAGKKLEGENFCFDIAKAHHIFVGGQTGSGKTSFLCAMITMLLHTKPEKSLQIVVIDPKYGTDYNVFKNHNKIELIIDMSEAYNKLKDLETEMNKRYEMVGKKEATFENMPYIVCFIDELNDLVYQYKNINDILASIARKGRQCRIHLVLGTQRPDANIFDGQLRSSITARIALKVVKGSESKIILDETGAETLLPRGDSFIKIDNSDGMARVQCVRFEEEEMENLILNPVKI